MITENIFNHYQHSPLTSYRVQLKCSDSVCKWKSLSRVRLFMNPWTIQPMEFSRPEYWSGSLSPLQGIFPTQGSNSGLQHLWSRGISQGGQQWGQGRKAWTKDSSAWVPSEWDGCTIYPFSFPFPSRPPHFLSIREHTKREKRRDMVQPSCCGNDWVHSSLLTSSVCSLSLCALDDSCFWRSHNPIRI